MTDRPAFVLLEDGAWFPGTTARPIDPSFGEVVFTTNLTGYQETFTDPSYLGQIVVMTAPMIGNYGVNAQDMESARPQVTGVVVRELSRHPSNWQSTRSLGDWLAEAGVPVLEEIDTRRLTRHLRERGAMRGVVAEGRQPSRELSAQLLASPSMEGLDLASRATVREPWSEGQTGPHVVAYDYGMKRNIVRMLVSAGCRVTVVPAGTPAAAVRALNPDGLFLSNGPGDPAAVAFALATLRDLAGSGLPTFGICLGHQFVGLAFGGSTAKLPYGHRGGNQPVKNLEIIQEIDDPHEQAEVARALGIAREDLDESLPIQVITTGLPCLVVPIRSLADLRDIRVDATLLADIYTRHGGACLAWCCVAR